MRRIGKWLLSFLLAVGALALTVGAVFLANERWQQQTVHAFLEERTGWRWDLGSVKLGWNRVQATEVFTMRAGQGFEAAEVDLGVRTRSLVSRDPVVVRGGSVTGCYLDLSAMPVELLGLPDGRRSAESLPEAAGEAVVRQMLVLGLEQLQAQSVSLRLVDVRVAGRVDFPRDLSLRFDCVIEEASTLDPTDFQLRVTEAGLR